MYKYKYLFEIPTNFVDEIRHWFQGKRDYGYSWISDVANEFGIAYQRSYNNKTQMFEIVMQSEHAAINQKGNTRPTSTYMTLPMKKSQFEHQTFADVIVSIGGRWTFVEILLYWISSTLFWHMVLSLPCGSQASSSHCSRQAILVNMATIALSL